MNGAGKEVIAEQEQPKSGDAQRTNKKRGCHDDLRGLWLQVSSIGYCSKSLKDAKTTAFCRTDPGAVHYTAP